MGFYREGWQPVVAGLPFCLGGETISFPFFRKRDTMNPTKGGHRNMIGSIVFRLETYPAVLHPSDGIPSGDGSIRRGGNLRHRVWVLGILCLRGSPAPFEWTPRGLPFPELPRPGRGGRPMESRLGPRSGTGFPTGKARKISRLLLLSGRPGRLSGRIAGH